MSRDPLHPEFHPASASSREDDFDRGLKNRRAVMGDAFVDRALGQATAFNADFQSFITRYAWHGVWGRPGLDRATRRLLVLVMTLGLGRWEEFEGHCRGAVRAAKEGRDLSIDQIREALMQAAIYCGVPAANTAFKITAQILVDEGLAPPPSSLLPESRVETHHTFSQPQLRVALQGVERGTPIVLAHALGLDLSLWDGLAAELGRDHPVLRYDQRGHGGSAVPPGPYTLDDLVDDGVRLLREWGRGPVVWVGLSLGGMVGQGLAVRHPEWLRGLVISNSVARYAESTKPGWAERIAAVESGGLPAIVDATLARFFHAAEPAVVERTRQVLLRSDPAGYVAACHAAAGVDWLDQLAAIRLPVLVIAGARDAGAPPEAGRAIAERIPGAEFALLDESAHIGALEQPTAFLELVREFSARL